MKRRTVVCGITAAAARPGCALAQTSRKPVVGFLFHSNPVPMLLSQADEGIE